ncbi:MAG: hypothetical protein AAFN77_10840 [Planctomycetota bacterium]
MFENLTDREKKLLYGTLMLAPIALVFVAVFWFTSSYNQNDEELFALEKSIAAEKDKELSGFKANRRRNFYNSKSLPPSVVSATNEYGAWLKLLLEEQGLEISSYKPLDAGTIRVSARDPEIGRRKSFSIQAKGNLAELNSFMKEFYSVDLLHRINSLKVIPKTEGTGSKKVRTGELSLIMTIETVSLAQADNRDNFTDAKRALVRNGEDYDSLLRRNIFGPANNKPTLSVRSTTVTTGNPAIVNITAKDTDEKDDLTFELLESSIEGIKLETTNSPSRRTKFTVPSQEPGKYEFKVKVFDNGYPPKESIEVASVTFRPKPAKKVETAVKPVEPPKPKFKHATQTRVTGIVRNRDGNWIAFVTVRTTDDRYRLKLGDTFELDELKWEVTAIKSDEVKFQAGEKTFVARPNPRDRGKLIEVSTVKEDPVESTDF